MLPKAASYTYFPRVKDLDQPSPVADLDDLDLDLEKNGHAERTSDSSSGGSSPSSEEAPDVGGLQMRPQLRSNSTRKSSRFLSFGSKSREPSAERRTEKKADRGRTEAVKKTDSPSNSPGRSLTKLRRKSWMVSQPSSASSSPTRERKAEKAQKKEEAAAAANKTQAAADQNKRKSPTTTSSIPEESEARDTVHHEIQQPVPLSKKNKRLSGLFNATASTTPAVPKSFSTEKLPNYPQEYTPTSPTHNIPPLPRNISTEKLKGAKTEPRKKDELWNAFRTLDADLRKYATLCKTVFTF